MADKFNYRYSAPSAKERKEIINIKNQYLKPNPIDEKITKIKKMNNIVKNTPFSISLAIGITGILTFGLGLTFILKWNDLIPAIAFMVVGSILMICGYPIYKMIFSSLKKKYGPIIISLSEEVLKDE